MRPSGRPRRRRRSRGDRASLRDLRHARAREAQPASHPAPAGPARRLHDSADPLRAAVRLRLRRSHSDARLRLRGLPDAGDHRPVDLLRRLRDGARPRGRPEEGADGPLPLAADHALGAADRPHAVRIHDPLPADVRVVGFRPGRLDARLAPADRRAQPVYHDGRRRARPLPRNARRQRRVARAPLDAGDHRRLRPALRLAVPTGRRAVTLVAVPPARHLLRARDLADARYFEALGVDDLARAARLSRAHFSREFRRAFGESPHAYLLTRRLERAAALLRITDRSVADICFSVGLQSVGSFTTSFTRTYGLSPAAYRAR